LNFVWPNVFEQSPHVMMAFYEAVEGLSRALGPSIILSHLLPGLFHPARRVREIYWKIYNNIQIGHADALTAFYPRIKNDPVNQWERAELDLMV
jgi:splicing factor 3B subunit 1